MKRILSALLLTTALLSCGQQAETRSNNAVWIWSKYMNEIDLDELKAKDIDNVILHEVAFEKHGVDSTMAFVKAARERGILVHIWFQVFYSGGKWVSPVDDENVCYKQDYYDEVISRAESYLDRGIEAIHLDYIRFGGTAWKHNPSETVTATGAVTEFCRQLSARLRAKNPAVILSAALMPEPDSEYYYGQDPAQMGQYIDILMPMIYRHSPAYAKGGEKWATEVANWFAEKGAPAKVWAGTTTYTGDDGKVTPMDVDGIMADCIDLRDNSAAEGIVFFRYGIGDLPDMTGFWDEKQIMEQ